MGLTLASCGSSLDVLPDRALESICVLIADWNPNQTPGLARTSSQSDTTTFAEFEQGADRIDALAPDIRNAEIRGEMMALAGMAETFGTRVRGAAQDDLRYQSRNYEAERDVRRDMLRAVNAARRSC